MTSRMVREDLVEGAITFLQDPSVASAPIEQRVAFLRSKNLTQEEIDTSLARVGQEPAPASAQQAPVQYRQIPPQYNAYPPQYWQQPPPELPRRDWRDWFIAATVMGGVGYALYWTAKRYVVPLIAPPTPAQLEQDKASVDASFDKAFALLEQLASDTQELKDSEAARKERLDSALSEVESVISRMKQANEDREAEAKRLVREMGDIRDQIPRAIEKEREATDNRLKDLATEMKSLKTLVANRMSGGAAPGRTTPSFSSTAAAHSSPVNGTRDSIPAPIGAANTNGASATSTPAEDGAKAPWSAQQQDSGSGSSYSRFIGGGKANSIPSWQLEAKKRTEKAKADDAAATGGSTPNVGDTGTVAGEVGEE